MTEIRTTSSTGGQKGVKPQRHSLLPKHGLDVIAEVFGFGAAKYADHNWRRKYEWSKSYDALQRHLTAWWDGEDVDPESGLSHLGHAGFHILVLATWERLDGQGSEFDDRHTFHRPQESAAEEEARLLEFEAALDEDRPTPLLDELMSRPIQWADPAPRTLAESAKALTKLATEGRMFIAPVAPETNRRALIQALDAYADGLERERDGDDDVDLGRLADDVDYWQGQVIEHGGQAAPSPRLLGDGWQSVGWIDETQAWLPEGQGDLESFQKTDISEHLKVMQDAINQTVGFALNAVHPATFRLLIGLPRFSVNGAGEISDADHPVAAVEPADDDMLAFASDWVKDYDAEHRRVGSFGPDLLPKRRPVDQYTIVNDAGRRVTVQSVTTHNEEADFEWPTSMRTHLQRALDRRP